MKSVPTLNTRHQLNMYERRLLAWEDELRTNRHGYADFAPRAIEHLRAFMTPEKRRRIEYWESIPQL